MDPKKPLYELLVGAAPLDAINELVSLASLRASFVAMAAAYPTTLAADRLALARGGMAELASRDTVDGRSQAAEDEAAASARRRLLALVPLLTMALLTMALLTMASTCYGSTYYGCTHYGSTYYGCTYCGSPYIPASNPMQSTCNSTVLYSLPTHYLTLTTPEPAANWLPTCNPACSPLHPSCNPGLQACNTRHQPATPCSQPATP